MSNPVKQQPAITDGKIRDRKGTIIVPTSVVWGLWLQSENERMKHNYSIGLDGTIYDESGHHVATAFGAQFGDPTAV